MIPIVTPEEMGAIDAAAPESVEVLIDRAGAAATRTALDLLGGSYGRRVAVVAGKGNNGNDGRSAAVKLRRRGVRVEVFDAADAPGELPEVDLVIDAAYGTGFGGSYDAPDPGGAAVLAIDIPSGVDGLTGIATDGAVRADVTITFAALKPGLLFADGRHLVGDVEVVDIGLDVSRATRQLIEPDDLARLVPKRGSGDHKWGAACLVVAGSPGMGGAAHMAASAAQRGGAGMVQVLTPGADHAEPMPVEAVALDGRGEWIDTAIEQGSKAHSIVIGPGLDPSALDPDDLVRLVSGVGAAVVVDGGAIDVVARRPDVLSGRPAVLTPHAGEFARLTGSSPGDDRIASTIEAAARTGCVVLLKGPTTVIADPDGRVVVMADGDARLATAGAGDVLAGLIGAFLARGAEPIAAAAAAAELHAWLPEGGPPAGLVAFDLVEAIGDLRHDLDV